MAAVGLLRLICANPAKVSACVNGFSMICVALRPVRIVPGNRRISCVAVPSTNKVTCATSCSSRINRRRGRHLVNGQPVPDPAAELGQGPPGHLEVGPIPTVPRLPSRARCHGDRGQRNAEGPVALRREDTKRLRQGSIRKAWLRKTSIRCRGTSGSRRRSVEHVLPERRSATAASPPSRWSSRGNGRSARSRCAPSAAISRRQLVPARRARNRALSRIS